MSKHNKDDFFEQLEDLKFEGLTATAGLLELVSDGAKAVRKVTKRKAAEIRAQLSQE